MAFINCLPPFSTPDSEVWRKMNKIRKRQLENWGKDDAEVS
jgi:hypothetical protein